MKKREGACLQTSMRSCELISNLQTKSCSATHYVYINTQNDIDLPIMDVQLCMDLAPTCIIYSSGIQQLIEVKR